MGRCCGFVQEKAVNRAVHALKLDRVECHGLLLSKHLSAAGAQILCTRVLIIVVSCALSVGSGDSEGPSQSVNWHGSLAQSSSNAAAWHTVVPATSLLKPGMPKREMWGSPSALLDVRAKMRANMA